MSVNLRSRISAKSSALVSIILDEHTLLRSYQPPDAAALFRAVNNSRAELRPWLNWVDLTTKEQHSLQYIQHAIAREHEQRALSLGIFRNQEIIGGLGMQEWDQQLHKAEVGYWIARDWQRQGIGRKAVSRFLDFLFHRLHLNKVELKVVGSNEASRHFALSLGAKPEACLRMSVLRHGSLEDLLVFGILAKEWKMEHVKR